MFLLKTTTGSTQLARRNQ